MSGISIREFARREGCSDTAVHKAIKTGALHKLPDGSLDEALVGTGWRPSNRRIQGRTPAEGAEAALREAVVIPPIADSEAKKEFYLAELRQLEYDLKSGLVSPNAEQVAIVAAAMARVRTRLLAIPSEAAPALHRCKTVQEAEAELRRRVTEALEELSSGRAE